MSKNTGICKVEVLSMVTCEWVDDDALCRDHANHHCIRQAARGWEPWRNLVSKLLSRGICTLLKHTSPPFKHKKTKTDKEEEGKFRGDYSKVRKSDSLLWGELFLLDISVVGRSINRHSLKGLDRKRNLKTNIAVHLSLFGLRTPSTPPQGLIDHYSCLPTKDFLPYAKAPAGALHDQLAYQIQWDGSLAIAFHPPNLQPVCD